ncbi:MAG: hypothetical protein U0N24_11285 [Sellimonas intestinalis]|nr:hypothetical protein [Sellimonas intestinalis]
MYRKQDFKSSSVIGYGGYRDRSVMGMDNILHNRKSKPCSGRFGCDKWCENFFHLSFGNAAAGVFDSDVKLIAFGPYVKADGTGTMDGFSGIFKKIQYGLPEFHRISSDDGEIFLEPGSKLYVRGGTGRSKREDQSFHKITERKGFRPQVIAVIVKRKFLQKLHHVVQIFAQRIPVVKRAHLRVLGFYELNGTGKQSQRISDFVADFMPLHFVGQEQFFKQCRRFGILPDIGLKALHFIGCKRHRNIPPF